MDSSALTLEQRKYLTLFTEALTESPVKLEDGTLLSYEDVVAALNRDLLSYACSVGIDGGGQFKCGSFSQNFSLTCQVSNFPSFHAIFIGRFILGAVYWAFYGNKSINWVLM